MSYELMFQKALKLQQEGALSDAEQIYRQILETAPNNADVLNLLGLIAQQRGFHQEACSYFYRAAESAPKHFPIFFNLAISLEAIGRHLEALEAYAKVLFLKPDVKEAHYGRGNIFWLLKQNEKAESEFEQALALDNDYAEAAANLADLRNDEKTLENLSLKYPNCATTFYYLARRKISDKDYTKAKQYLMQADKLLNSDEIKVMLGEVLLESNSDKNEALKLFYQAVDINPHNTQALLKIADLEAENSNFKEAEKYYKKAIETDENNLSAHTNYANLLCKNKRTLEALEEYRKAVLIAPDTPEISYNLALILKELQEYEQALSLMFNAYYKAPEHQDWSINLAETLILFNKTAPEKAKKIASNWYEKMPENIVAKHLWAVINGQKSEVEEKYNRLLFDTFAPTYEATLQKINYQAVQKIAEICWQPSGKILDLGCGSGLLGEALKNDKNEIIGVDISEKMLALASQKKVYTKLECAEIIDFLKKNTEHFDLITASDVFCYFDNLEEIFKLCLPMKLVFSVEINPLVETFVLQPNGRWQHNPKYIENALKSVGYSNILIQNIILRQEDETDVCGAILTASV